MDTVDLSLLEEFVRIARSAGAVRLTAGPYSIEFAANTADMQTVYPPLPVTDDGEEVAVSRNAIKSPYENPRLFGGKRPTYRPKEQ